MSESDSEILPEPEYEEEEFTFGDVKLSITTIAYMPIELLMANRTKDTEISGQKLWCGSLGVLQYVLNNAHQLLIEQPTTVIELGAGTGVLGLMCKKLGAAEVILTDHDEKSLEHMRRDCSANGEGACVVHKMDWFLPDIPISVTSTRNRLLILAGDVLYKHSLLNPFFDTLKAIITTHQGLTEPHILLCHIPRAGVEQLDVIEKARSASFSIDIIPKEDWKSGSSFEYCDSEDLERAQLYRMKFIR